MPAQISALETMDEDQMIEEVLDKFVNCHEQTYEEFLSTFTHLSKEDNVTQRGAFGTNSSENILISVQFTHENEPDDHLRSKGIFLRTSSQCSEEEQMVLDEGQKVGRSLQGDLNEGGKVKVDNFLEGEDLDMDEEIKPQMSKDLLLLPGEVEQDISTHVPSYVLSYIPSTVQPVTPGVKPRPAVEVLAEEGPAVEGPAVEGPAVEGPAVEGADKQRDEILSDEVQPFRLDEEFDYDTVMLTPKFTPAEMEAIKELSKQKREDIHTDVGEPQVCVGH